MSSDTKTVHPIKGLRELLSVAWNLRELSLGRRPVSYQADFKSGLEITADGCT